VDHYIDDTMSTADDGRPKATAHSLFEEAKLKASKFFEDDNNRPTDPILGNQHKNRGNQKFAEKQWEEAYDEYSHAIHANSRDAAFYSNRSACLIQMNRPEEALEDAVFARTLRPDWSKANYRTAVALLAMTEEQGSLVNSESDDNGDDDESIFETAAIIAWEGLLLDPKNTDLKILLRRCAKSGRQAFRRRVKRNNTQ
jgi:tetratricopeptide (TPR) repeat protein